MAERERILQKLEKVRALADRGIGGERENAEQLLATLMARHNITDEDLECETVSTHWIRWQTKWERKLLHQLAYVYLGSGHSFGCVGSDSGRSRKKVGISCTTAVFIEIQADYEFYRKALDEDMDLFYSAFIAKNELYPPPELAMDDEDDSECNLERNFKVGLMMAGIDQRTRHKAIEVGSKTSD